MSATDKLTQIRTLLGLETKLEQMKLENGTVLEADKFESDQPVFILTEDEKVALPIGEYKMESGLTLSVEKEGIIAKLGEEAKEEAEEEIVEEETEETEDLGYVSREEFNLALEEIKKMIDDLKPEEKEEEKEEVEEVEEEVEEMSDEKAELKAELSKPASAPLKHNPEASTQKSVNFKYGQNRKKSTFDIILEKLNK